MHLPVDAYRIVVVHIGGNATESKRADRAIEWRFAIRSTGTVLLIIEWVSLVRYDWEGVELEGPIWSSRKIDECSPHFGRNIVVNA